MNDEIRKNINNIIENISYLKKKKDFKSLIEKLYFIMYNEKIWEKILENIIEEENNLTEENKKKIYWITKNFIQNNSKEYINKISKKEWIIYEYEDHYDWYIFDKNIKIIEEYNLIFKDKKIISIHLDNQLRKKIEKITKEDLKYSKTIRLKIKK